MDIEQFIIDERTEAKKVKSNTYIPNKNFRYIKIFMRPLKKTTIQIIQEVSVEKDIYNILKDKVEVNEESGLTIDTFIYGGGKSRTKLIFKDMEVFYKLTNID